MDRTEAFRVFCLNFLGCTKAQVFRFDVAPRNFCSVPQRVNIDWEGRGSSATLRAEPPVAEIPGRADVGLSGSRDATVTADSTRFIVTVTASSSSDEETETASRLTGSVNHPIGGIAECDSAGNFRLDVEVSTTEYTRDVVVRSITNRKFRDGFGNWTGGLCCSEPVADQQRGASWTAGWIVGYQRELPRVRRLERCYGGRRAAKYSPRRGCGSGLSVSGLWPEPGDDDGA